MRQTRRNPEEKIEDGFADLSLEKQAAMLERLRSLHRWCVRERSRGSAVNGTEQRLPFEPNSANPE